MRLIEELSRLRKSFESFRKDTNKKFESILDTYSESMMSMMQDLVEVKRQLNVATTKIMELEDYAGRYKRNNNSQTNSR
jgi:hypothetical protein